MANPVIMPRQGQSVESCIISSWFKNEGDEIKKGDMLFSYETDKAAFECESEFEGILLKRLFQEGDEVPVLKMVAIIGNPGESIDQFSEDSEFSAREGIFIAGNKEKEDSGTPAVFNVARPEGEKIRISPLARKKAQGLGINYEGIRGSGPNGRIMKQDIIMASKTDSFVTPPATWADEDFEIRKLSNMRKIIAAKMKESLQNSAQLTHHTSADARRLLEFRKKAKDAFEKGAPENVTINDMVCYAVVRALKKHPMVNCHLLDDSIRIFHKVHLGLAVDTERGLMVPTVRNADDLTIQGLASQLKAVANSCKKGNINPELLASESATFSVSNLGSFGVELFTPVINLPQVAILGVNTIINRPTDLGNGVFGFVPFIGLSLTYDHRALDGAPASAFLREIRLEIEQLDFISN